jgi:hypothetical protein
MRQALPVHSLKEKPSVSPERLLPFNFPPYPPPTAMRQRRIIIIGLLVLLIPGLLFLFVVSRVPVLRVAVVDESGTPVPGATITPDGIRGSDHGHYLWREEFSVKPLSVTTDQNGAAKIPFPRYIVERVRSIELSFGVDHPDYSPARPFVKVGSPLRSNTPFLQRLRFFSEDFFESGKTERIILKSGAALELAARLEDHPLAATNLHAQLIPADGVFDGKFVREGDRLRTRKIPPGDYFVRAFSRLDGTNYFSRMLKLHGTATVTNSVTVDLLPGHNVEGRLAGVDAPITNGWVNARVMQNSGQQLLSWADFAEVQPDGTFKLTGLPPGRLECVAICDGYLSGNPTNSLTTFVLPHTFDLPGSSQIQIPMIQSADANIRVLDPDGNPVAGASVHFWPNVRWGDWYSTIFASDFYREYETLQRNDNEAWRTRVPKRTFSATTSADGRAIVRDLPTQARDFSISHPELALPLDSRNNRAAILNLVPGQTNYSAVKLEPKGASQRD